LCILPDRGRSVSGKGGLTLSLRRDLVYSG
jgi:hypothetical protein